MRRVIAADVLEFITDNINLSIKLKVVLIVKIFNGFGNREVITDKLLDFLASRNTLRDLRLACNFRPKFTMASMGRLNGF